jgi:aspartate/methionine/tyrosine aminotransferase
MKIPEFRMERWQSRWEHRVRFNLGESGVHPLALGELIPDHEMEELGNTGLGYVQTDGTPELKSRIAALYPGSSPENILVTTGSVEANFLLLWHLIEPGSPVLFMRPNYLQIQGLIQAFGGRLSTFDLQERLGWGPDLDEIKALHGRDFKLIVITDPNNPTGGILDPEHRQALVDLASACDAWLLVDEVYRGAELESPPPACWWGAYPKTIATGGLSKAYGLPGLRVGWLVGPPPLIEACWSAKDYTSIAISALSDRLAVLALDPVRRRSLLERARRIIGDNRAVLESWLKPWEGLLNCIPPRAGAIAFIRYSWTVNSTRLAEDLRRNQGVLLCPGDHFGMDQHLRVGLGNPSGELRNALAAVAAGLERIDRSRS